MFEKRVNNMPDKYRWCEWRETATQNGVSYSTFTSRLKLGHWTHERAATQPTLASRKRCADDVYALYKGDEHIATGTIAEIADVRKVTVKTMWFYTTTSAAKRTSSKGLRLIPLDYDEFDY